jgi:hypothetical protein
MPNNETHMPITLNSDNLTRRHNDALMYCLQELNREHPDYQAAQVYATLSLEEALRDLALAIGLAPGRLCDKPAL